MALNKYGKKGPYESRYAISRDGLWSSTDFFLQKSIFCYPFLYPWCLHFHNVKSGRLILINKRWKTMRFVIRFSVPRHNWFRSMLQIGLKLKSTQTPMTLSTRTLIRCSITPLGHDQHESWHISCSFFVLRNCYRSRYFNTIPLNLYSL